MSNVDFIPSANGPFDDWQDNFVKKVNTYKSGWHWAPDTDTEWTLLTADTASKKSTFVIAWAKVKTKQFEHHDEVALTKARHEYESGHPDVPADTSLRIFISRYIRNNPYVTDEQKSDIGIKIPDTVISPNQEANVKLAEPELVGSIKGMEHLKHIIQINYKGKKKFAKEKGVAEISIFIAFTAADVKTAPPISAFKYDNEAARGRYVRVFTDDQEGMRAWYYVCRRYKGKMKTFGPPSVIWGSVIP